MSRVLLCSGKIYYDLLKQQQEDKRKDVAIVRVEQLYPFPEQEITELKEKYGKADFYWVQEEPKNMGAWMHLGRYDFPVDLKYIGRKSSASPATGFKNSRIRNRTKL
ncbi:MAG: hypothetical protein R2852_04915 [Bacteroidia bacterium]